MPSFHPLYFKVKMEQGQEWSMPRSMALIPTLIQSLHWWVVPRVTNIDILLTISIHNEEKRLWELVTWLSRGRHFDLLLNPYNCRLVSWVGRVPVCLTGSNTRWTNTSLREHPVFSALRKYVCGSPARPTLTVLKMLPLSWHPRTVRLSSLLG